MKKRKLTDPKTGRMLSCYLAVDVDHLLLKLKQASRESPSKFTCAPTALNKLRNIREILKD